MVSMIFEDIFVVRALNAGNSNSRTSWKVADTGETYQQWHDNKLGAAKTMISDSED